jgi:pyruvate/2-oxoacid:ferredoxin oxidoreductase beta subunit
MPNYQNGKIYTIRSRSRHDLVYVGSTTQTLSKRFGEHITLRNPTASKHIVDIGDAYIELIENCPCSNREELNRREGEVMRSMDCVNKQVPGRTKQEWRQDHQERLKQNHKDYHTNNKERLNERTKNWRKDNPSYMKDYNQRYQEEHSEQLKQYKHEYRQNNNKKIADALKQHYQAKKSIQTCICGSTYNYGRKQNRTVHYRSKKHQAHLELIYTKNNWKFI